MTQRDLAYYVDGLVEGRRGTLVQRQKDRSVWRVEHRGETWYAKRGVTPKRQREIRRETGNANALREAGFGPPVLASGLHGGGRWLVTADAYAAGGLPLRFGLKARRSRAFLESVGSSVRRLHDAGLEFPDLTSEHAWVMRDGGLWLIDSARMVRRACPAAVGSRARDLAALLFSTLRLTQGLSRADRVRILRAATGMEGDALRSFCRTVDAQLVRLRDRTRWRWLHYACTEEFHLRFASTAAVRSDASIGADEIIDRRNWIEIRTLPDRQNRVLRDAADTTTLYFAKFYPANEARTPASLVELEAIDLFRRAGILVNSPAAHVEDRHLGSLVAVAAARGEPLDDLLRRSVTVAERRALAVQTARIWRRMRECGLRHRDAYACHLFVAPWKPWGTVPASGTVPVVSSERRSGTAADSDVKAGTVPDAGTVPRHELRLIDLTRAGRAPFPKERWFVKDAAALWHGCPKPPVTRTDAVRWLREYFRIPKLDARAKRFARRVAAKEARVAARQRRKAKR